MNPLLGVVIGFIAGSIPSAHIAGLLHGVDLREHGSGNLGATNVGRVLGWPTGMVVLLVDILKGALPVLFIPPLLTTDRPDLWALAVGVAAIVGHVRPIFLLGRGGGKGVATAAGVFLALAWLPFLLTQVVFFGVLSVTRYMSLASLVAALTLPIAILAVTRNPVSPVLLASIPIVLFVFWNHRSNIQRLANGTEPKLSFKRWGR